MMTALVYLIEQLATGLYILIGAMLVWNIRKWMQSRAEQRAATFELERNMEKFRQANAITMIVILIQAAIVVFGVQTIVAPAVRARDTSPVVANDVVTDGVFVTFTPAPPAVQVIDDSGVNLFPTDPAAAIRSTPLPTPTPVGTLDANPDPFVGCDGGAQLQIPANGMFVFEPISVTGVADIPDFAFYKLEVSGPSTLGDYVVLVTNPARVPERGGLGQFVPAPYEFGQYQFRLTVFDTTGTLRAACMVNINIIAPPIAPTANTALGG
jgi:hypothetical protein